MATAKGQVVKLIIGSVLLVGSAIAIVFELRPDSSETATPVQAPPATVEERAATTDPQDAAVEAALALPQRYVALPKADTSFIFRDASGHVWFDGSGMSLPEFKRSIERAAEGKTHILRGGKILLVDSRGRYWCTGSFSPYQLDCYDGKSWLPPHEQPAPKTGKSTAHFLECAAEDSAGNCYFLSQGSRQSPTLHCYSSAGTWTTAELPAGAPEGNWKLTTQTNGRVAIYRGQKVPQGNGISPAMAGIMMQVMKQHGFPTDQSPAAAYIWDGQSFAVFSQGDIEGKKVNAATPLPDGSLLVTYQGTEEVTLSWPAGASAKLDVAAQAHIKNLGDRDPAVRKAAYSGLLKLGPQVRPMVEKAKADPHNQQPQKQDSLETLLTELASAGTVDRPVDDTLFGGRYRLNGVTETSRGLDGTVRLFAKQCDDTARGEAYGPSFITVDPNGEWHARPIGDDPKLAWLPSAVGEALEDSHGLLWLDHREFMNGDYSLRVVVNPADLSVRPAVPPGIDISGFRECDRNGKIFCGTKGGWLVIDPTQPEPKPDLPLHLYPGHGLAHQNGEPDAWLVSDVPQHITALGQLAPVVLDRGLLCTRVIPLRNGRAFIVCKPNRDADFDYAYFWDGQKMQNSIGGKYREQVEGRPVDLMESAGFTFDGHFNALTLDRLASDNNHGIWCVGREPDFSQAIIMDDQVPRQLAYYDGADWHDAWGLLKADVKDADDRKPSLFHDFTILGAVDRGHSVLIYSRDADTITALSFADGKLVRKPVESDLESPMLSEVIASPKGKTWFWSGGPNRSGTLCAYDNGKLHEVAWHGMPMLADSKDRLWCVNGTTLTVGQAEKWTEVSVSDLDDRSRIIEGPDGRFWLLHGDGGDEIRVGSDNGLTLANHFSFHMPMKFEEAFCDGASNLWFGGSGGQVARMQLPKP